MVALGGVFFAFACPFYSYTNYTFLERIIFWIPPFAVAFVTIAISHSIVLHGFGVKNIVVGRFATYFIFSFLFTPLLYTFFEFGPLINQGAEISIWLVGSWVLLTAGLGTWAFAIMNPERLMPIVEGVEPETKSKKPRLLRRLDLKADDVAITRLTVNDHYVVVGLSDDTEQRLLMRLSDAVNEMDDTSGFITHRSHWVSQAHVVGMVYEDKREMLRLTTGVHVPISRTYRPVLAAAGFLPKAKPQRVVPLKHKSPAE